MRPETTAETFYCPSNGRDYYGFRIKTGGKVVSEKTDCVTKQQARRTKSMELLRLINKPWAPA